MTKEQLVKEVAKKNDLSLVKTQAVLDDAVEIISKRLKKDGRFAWAGFGALTVKSVKKRKIKGVDGKDYVSPKHKRVSFKAFKNLNDKINNAKK